MTGSNQNKISLPEELSRKLLDHQEWLSSEGRLGQRMDEDETVFENLNLAGLDFSKVLLRHATFEGGSIRGARFIGADLHSATFDGCDVAQADFTNADLRWAAFDTRPEQACFHGAKLYKTAWTFKEGCGNDWLYAAVLIGSIALTIFLTPS
jgi:uncharacterized protein YjbI with pentapeptide repeats